MFEESPKIENEKVSWPGLEKQGVSLFIKREDLLHPTISGNKFRKLKYNLLKVKEGHFDGLITFGGAWSNHIYATAAACKEFGVKCVGVIRGEEPKTYSDTLLFAKECGMHLHFVSREEYREKDLDFYKTYLRNLYGNMYIIPEGGSNYLGVQGCLEILNKEDDSFTDVVVAAGTGATAAGIVISSKSHQKTHVYPALKGGDFLKEEIESAIYWAMMDTETVDDLMQKVNLVTHYHFGGYAKVKPDLLSFISEFHKINNIKLDPIYTGKMLFGLIQEIQSGKFPKGSKILAIHTGGLQGVAGIEKQHGIKLFE